MIVQAEHTLALTQTEQAALATFAGAAIEHELEQQPQIFGPKPDAPALCAPVGAFVTLTRHGRLRGCIGHLSADTPLYQTVAHMARAAAFHDPRFPPLQAEEWPDTGMEISVLSPILPCPAAQAVDVGRHGLVLVCGARSGVFLPQVPVEQGWNREQFLEALCGKAGLPPGSWQAPDARLFWFEAQVFAARIPVSPVSSCLL